MLKGIPWRDQSLKFKVRDPREDLFPRGTNSEIEKVEKLMDETGE